MYDFNNFISHWDNLYKDWKEAPETTIKGNVYLSKYSNNPEKSPLYGKDERSEFQIFRYRPEPYLGDPMDCCAVILNLNPGFGISFDEENITEHPDYKLQYVDNCCDESYSCTALKFEPYLAGDIVNGEQNKIAKGCSNIPGGVLWWYGKYDAQIGKCIGGRIDYVKNLYQRWFNNPPNKLPFAVELCPWHSHNFQTSYIFNRKNKHIGSDLVNEINDYIITPALEATKGDGVLPFVICIGKAITDLCDLFGLKRVDGCIWNQDNQSKNDNWPTKDGKKVNRTYQLYERDGLYLLNIFAPGGNKPPSIEFQNSIEAAIIDKIRYYIHSSTQK